MVALLAAVLLGVQDTKWNDRESFDKALWSLNRQESPSRVRCALGRPSCVKKGSNWEIWFYGLTRKGQLPTFGQILFLEGTSQISYPPRPHSDNELHFGETPSASVISEAELIQGLNILGAYEEGTSPSEVTDVIRCVNKLLPFGEAKVKAILTEAGRLGVDGGSIPGYKMKLFWLVRALYDVPDNPPNFNPPAIGSYGQPNEAGLRNWPTFPLFMDDDIPFSAYYGRLLQGISEPFYTYFLEEGPRLALRKRPLVPPDDPFPAFLRDLEKYRKEPENYFLALTYDQLFWLVHAVYTPQVMKDAIARRWKGEPPLVLIKGMPGVRKADFDRFHGEFLALHARWDPAKMDYVLRGSQQRSAASHCLTKPNSK